MAKTAAEYAAQLAAAQNAWKSSAGNAAAQKTASTTADQLRKEAASAGVNLSGYGTSNGYGTDYTRPQGSGMNANGTPNTTGIKDLGYGYHSSGDINTSPWKASTYDDSVRIIGKSSTDWNAERARLLDSAYKTNDWTGYNAFDAKNKAANASPSSGTSTMSNGGGGGYSGQSAGYSGSSGSSASDLIRSSYESNYAAQAQKLKAARDQSLAALAGQDSLIHQSAYDNRNSNDVMAAQALQRVREQQANQGVNGGDSITATLSNNTDRQQSANNINTNEGNQIQQLTAQRDSINNNASADDLALMQQLQAARDTALAGQMNLDRGFDYNAGQDAIRNGQWDKSFDYTKGVDQRNFDYGAGQDSIQNNQWQQGFDRAGVQQGFENRFNYGQATGTFGNGQQTLDNKKFQYTQGRDKVADGQWQQEFTRRAQQDGIQNAISWANNSLSADDNARQWADLDNKIQNPSGSSYSGLSANQVLDNVGARYTDKDADGNNIGVTKDPVKREQMFLDVVDMGLPSDTETSQVLKALGLTKSEIDAFKQKYGASPGK